MSSKESFTAEERAAMKARAKEMKSKADGETAVREAIAAMEPADRKLAERLHAIVAEAEPELVPKTWYGMPAWAKDGKVLCFFRDAGTFKDRYATFGFNDNANLDDGSMWPTSYAITKLTKDGEARIRELVKQAAS
jgi:uncharacterized protein YdhG (YjbR/CyaY superfamily)